MSTDPHVDAYIAVGAEFARPISSILRRTVHGANAELEETIKWGMPFFVYSGKPIASMAAFKAHCAFRFWHAQVVADPGNDDQVMGQFGRLTRLADVPPERELAAIVHKPEVLVDAGVKPARAPKIGAPKNTAASAGSHAAT